MKVNRADLGRAESVLREPRIKDWRESNEENKGVQIPLKDFDAYVENSLKHKFGLDVDQCNRLKGAKMMDSSECTIIKVSVLNKKVEFPQMTGQGVTSLGLNDPRVAHIRKFNDDYQKNHSNPYHSIMIGYILALNDGSNINCMHMCNKLEFKLWDDAMVMLYKRKILNRRYG